MDDYLSKQILTYMGNKRKLIPHISNTLDIVIDEIINELLPESGKEKKLVMADAFSGTGIVSRLMKTKCQRLYSNDIAGYARTLNECFLSNVNVKEEKQILEMFKEANKFAYNSETDDIVPKWISRHWAPDIDIKKDQRTYFTPRNGLLIDKYRFFINNYVSKKYQCYLLSSLLIESSIHNNTNGQFSAYFKDKNGIGKFGGENSIDINRITQEIKLEMPTLYNNNCESIVSRLDVEEWLGTIPEVDIIYIDPPYNKHPYCIYYFMLDIINDWDTSAVVPATNRGQPKNWTVSDFNSYKHAEKAFVTMLDKIRAKYVMLSYNNKGIIPIARLESILCSKGDVKVYPVKHNVYNRLKGLANYKKGEKETENVKECIWVLKMGGIKKNVKNNIYHNDK